ncbi:MAG: o-succinylbenzoate synthase [Candidatus Bipolaricaulota bacterium]|nr:o-succinylbenzoate synthase [Candidatus Bipolaricaulota bacterium]MDW8126230.1 o-succinylbenzoate synthase [Candidatus Bipolaricaulota bacterium]
MIKLERMSLFLVELPLVSPFATSFGEERVKHALLVALTGDGVMGWGECVAGSGPWFSSETVETARYVISEHIRPILSAHKLIEHPSDMPKLLSPIRGHQMAKAAVEAATWDLYARTQKRPLFQILGGVREEIPAGVSVGIQPDIPTLLATVENFLHDGYQRIKLKIKPGWDLAPVGAVRERFPDILLSVDANAAYRLEDFPTLKELDRYGLLMLEQPLAFDDLLEHARLSQTLSTPICLDESVDSAHRAWEALELGACRIINVKQGRVGGVTEALAIHNLALARKVPLWCGGMLETGIGRALNVHLATLPGFTLPHDISATRRYFREDISEPPFDLQNGYIPVPKKPGLGVEINWDRLLRSCTWSRTWKL